MKKRVAATVAVGALVPTIFWLGGFDFERGILFALCAIYAIGLAALIYGYPGWHD